MSNTSQYITALASKIISVICSIVLLFLPFGSTAQRMTLSQKTTPEVVLKSGCYDILEDSFGFIWIGGNGLRKYDGYKTQKITVQSDSIPLGEVYDLLEDRDGNIWVGSKNGLFLYDRKKDQLIPKFYGQLKTKRGWNSKAAALFEDSKGQIWIGGDDRIFLLQAPDSKTFTTISGLDIEYSYQLKEGILAFEEDRNGNIYAATSLGLWEIKPDHSIRVHSPETFEDPIQKFHIIKIEKGNKDTLWLAGAGGLWVYETDHLKLSKYIIPGIPLESTREVFIDHKKQLWLATDYKVYLRDKHGKFEELHNTLSKKSEYVRIIYEDRYHNIWLGNSLSILKLEKGQHDMFPVYKLVGNPEIDDNWFFRIMQGPNDAWWFRMIHVGLGYCTALEEEFKILLRPNSKIFSGEIKHFCTDADDNVWVITLSNGLYLFPKGDTTYQQIDLGDSMLVAQAFDIIQDRQNDRFLWISSKFGLCKVDRFTFKRVWYNPNKDIPNLKRNSIGGITQDDENNIWAVFLKEDKRVYGMFDTKEKKFKEPLKIPQNAVWTSTRVRKKVGPNTIWVGTNNGLLIVNTRTKEGTFLDKKNGLPTTGVHSISPDHKGNVWYSTGQKLCKYDGAEFECFNVSPEIGSFTYFSSALLDDGRLMFGASNGLCVFDPEDAQKDSSVPQLYLTNFEVHNKKRKLGKAYELVNSIELPFDENDITMEFSGLYFLNQEKVKYRYKLDGHQANWVNTSGNGRKVFYTNLPPGPYTFKVEAASPNGIWVKGEDGLTIKLTILHPWYRTNWAYALWLSLLVGGIYGIYNFQLKRHLAEAEAIRLKELNQVKSRLYSNITHEFRTPLTIILGMTDQVKEDPKAWFSEGMQLIRRNGKQLLNLVNQMLDLSKLESGNMQLKLINGDIIAYVKYLMESFHSYADSKDIRLHFLSDFKSFEMDYDSEKLQNIISNLLSNAIKFTPSGGDVYFEIRPVKNEKGQIKMIVKDNGVGISEEHLPHIFDRFYQVDSSNTRQGGGTGIGLALTKELVHLMRGKIIAECPQDKGTIFIITLPVSQHAEKSASRPAKDIIVPIGATILQNSDRDQQSTSIPQGDTPIVLLIEDNKDVITYLSSFLEREYQIVTATNGQLGIEKAIQIIPDLIVSDVMMPEKDGYEVCELLKNDERTSHIPVILLTAKSDESSKIEGLKYGADAYLGKPFNKEELLVRIEKLISLRKQLQAHFKFPDAFVAIQKNKQPSREEVFLQKLISIVNENLEDENFGLPDLYKKAALSRSQLFRKLRAITGESPTHFIRSIRLAKGKELLEITNLDISEIAYKVGFRNPTYFTTKFGEEYGMTPTKYRERL